MTTEDTKKNKPRAVTHKALSEAAVEAYADQVKKSIEEVNKKLSLAEDRLQKACMAVLKATKRGRAMLAIMPNGVCAHRTDTSGNLFIYLEPESGEECLVMKCTPAVSRKLLVKTKAVDKLHSESFRLKRPQFFRTAYILGILRKDPEAWAEIGKIADKAISDHRSR